MPKVTIIILNYRQYESTTIAIRSALKQLDVEVNIIVVENDAPNMSFSKLEMQFENEHNVHFLCSGKNLGYAQGNNYGLIWAKEHQCLNELILIMNNDIEILESNLLSRLIEQFNYFKDMGAISPKIILKRNKLIQGPYISNSLAYLFVESVIPILIPVRILIEQFLRNRINKVKKVYRTMGSFVLFRREDFENIGFFDPNTFLGSEEDILSYKLKKIGKYFYYFPFGNVIHESGKSSAQKPNKFIQSQFIFSQLYFAEHYLRYGPCKLSLLEKLLRIRNFYRNSIAKVR